MENLHPVIDFHVHPKVPLEELISDMDEAGVSHAVILATETDPEDVMRPETEKWIRDTYRRSPLRRQMSVDAVIREIGQSLRSSTHVDNKKVYELAAKCPDRLIPFASVNLSAPAERVNLLLGEAAEHKAKGIKLLPYAQFTDPSNNENVELLMEHCRKTGAVILSHSGCAAGIFEYPAFSRFNRPMLWDGVLTKYPDVPLVLAHFASYSELYPGIWLNEAIELMNKHDNVFADLAAVTALLESETICRRIRKETGFEKVLFGTDYPMPRYVPGGSLPEVIAMIKELSHLEDREKRQLLGENAGKLLGII